MKSVQNVFEISEEVKNSLNIGDFNYDNYCKDRDIGAGYRINGFEIYIFSVKMESLMVYLSCKVFFDGEYDEHTVIVYYDTQGNMAIKGDFSEQELGDPELLDNAMEYLLDLHVPENFWQIKAMLN